MYLEKLSISSLKRSKLAGCTLLSLILPFFLISWGCGYSLKGEGSFLPEHIKVITVAEFQNQTPRFELEKVINQKLQEELLGRGSFILNPNQNEADALLTGIITQYKTSPKSLNEEGRATSYSIRIVLEIKFSDLKENRTLFEDKNYIITEEYQLTNLDEDFLDQEEFAIEEAAEQLAEALISAILEGF
jgi:outer membrane lipopolysaccharide assembly protein LptE/RlpB